MLINLIVYVKVYNQVNNLLKNEQTWILLATLNYVDKQRGGDLSQKLPNTIKTKTRVFVTIKPSLKLYVSTLRIRLKWVKSRTVNPTTDIDGRPPSEQLILRSAENIDEYGGGRLVR